MKINYSKTEVKKIAVKPKDLQPNTLYEFGDICGPDGYISQILITNDFKAIEFDGDSVKVCDFSDIRKETGFVCNFYLSEMSVTVKNSS